MVAHFSMRTYGVYQAFQLLKAFGYIVVRSSSEKDLFFIIRAQHVLSYHLITVPCCRHFRNMVY